MCKHSKTLCASDSYLLAAHRQRVPSPSGMPALELVDDLIDAINDPPARCMDADVSDERVTAYGGSGRLPQRQMLSRMSTDG